MYEEYLTQREIQQHLDAVNGESSDLGLFVC